MYLRISNDCIVPKCDIIGIFDMDNTTVSRQGREFLPCAEKKGCVEYTSDELPRSYVVTERNGRVRIYLSSLSSRSLINRARSAELME